MPGRAALQAAEEELLPGEFLKHWLVLKPIPIATVRGKAPDEAAQKQMFARDWLLDNGGEARILPQVGMKAKISSRTMKWQPLESDTGVFFTANDGHPMDYAITYAWTEFMVSEKQAAYLGIGSDEGVKVWLNGKPVHEHWICRGVCVDEDVVPVELQAGKNHLLLKVLNTTGPSGFTCRILNEEQAQCQKMFRAGIENGATNLLSDAEIKTMLQDNVDTEKQTVGLAVGIVDEHGPRVISHGKLDNGTDREVDGDTLFHIGSVAKVFTALLLQDMIERGEMKLDDPAQKYLPESVRLPTWHGREITLLHLATHTSGLPRESDGDLYAFLSHSTLGQAPGMHWEYSNLGMGLLGHLIARKAGKDYETLVVERICQPLGMSSTRISLPPELKARLAIGHAIPGHRLQSFSSPDHDTNSYVPSLLGAGSIRSTANDLLKFVSAYAGLTPSPLSALMKKAEALHSLESGDKRPLAWQEYGDVFEHGGLVDGYQTELCFDVRKRRGVVVLSNCANYSTFVPGLWRQLLDGRYPKPAGVSQLDMARLARYVGQYKTADGTIWIIRLEPNRFIIQWRGHPDERARVPSAEMFPQSESVFCNDFRNCQLMFLPVADHQASKMVLTSWGWQGSIEMTQISGDVPEPPAPVQMDPAACKDFVGQYRKTLLFGMIGVGPKLNISQTTDEFGGHLIAHVAGLGREEFFPTGAASFIPGPTVGDDIRLTFVRNRKGKVNQVMVNWNGRKLRGTRISSHPTK